MRKTCDNCTRYLGTSYWCVCKDSRPEEYTCEKFIGQCHDCYEKAEYRYNKKSYCFDCLLHIMEVDSKKITYFYKDGKPIGSTENIDEVIKNLGPKVKII